MPVTSILWARIVVYDDWNPGFTSSPIPRAEIVAYDDWNPGFVHALTFASEVRYPASVVKSPNVKDVGTFIREQRERSAMSMRKLADQAGISNPYLSQIERGLRRPSADILAAIAGALGLRTEHMFERAGLLDREDRPDVIGAIEGDMALTTSQKQAMTEIYRSFVGNGEG